jgi:hypothetical protein
MKTYKVRWAVEYINDEQIEHPSVSLEADSPEEAYAKFLDSETTVRNIDVIVEWGIFGFERFSEHIEEVERMAKEEERKQQKGERMSEREKQEQILRMMEEEQKGTPKLTPTTHTPKAEDVRETGPGGGSGGKTQQASVASSSSSRQEQILLRIESKLSQIHWAVLGVGMMFAMVFIITPQCSQM